MLWRVMGAGCGGSVKECSSCPVWDASCSPPLVSCTEVCVYPAILHTVLCSTAVDVTEPDKSAVVAFCSRLLYLHTTVRGVTKCMLGVEHEVKRETEAKLDSMILSSLPHRHILYCLAYGWHRIGYSGGTTS